MIITNNEINNALFSYNNILNHIKNEEYYQAITNFNDSSLSTLANEMTAGILNIGNLITSNLSRENNVNTFYQLSENLIVNHLRNSNFLLTFNLILLLNFLKLII